MESRKGNTAGKLRKAGQARSGNGLPHDFLELVQEVFTTHFDEPLQSLVRLKGGAEFQARGEIFPNELLLSVSLIHPDQLAATTVHASLDFDARASSPTAQDGLNRCVDALATVFSALIGSNEPARLETVASGALTELADWEGVPLEWTALEGEDKPQVFVKVDKSNLALDEAAEDWLARHDLASLEEDEGEQKDTEKLFVTGPKGPAKRVH
jgi:hypothetical protein